MRCLLARAPRPHPTTFINDIARSLTLLLPPERSRRRRLSADSLRATVWHMRGLVRPFLFFLLARAGLDRVLSRASARLPLLRASFPSQSRRVRNSPDIAHPRPALLHLKRLASLKPRRPLILRSHPRSGSLPTNMPPTGLAVPATSPLPAPAQSSSSDKKSKIPLGTHLVAGGIAGTSRPRCMADHLGGGRRCCCAFHVLNLTCRFPPPPSARRHVRGV